MGKHVYKGEASTKVSHGGLGCPHSQNGNILDLKYLQECLVLRNALASKKIVEECLTLMSLIS